MLFYGYFLWLTHKKKKKIHTTGEGNRKDRLVRAATSVCKNG